MTARPVRTTSTTTPVRRAPRLLLVAALVLSTISALGAATSAPAGAITPSVVHFTGEPTRIEPACVEITAPEAFVAGTPRDEIVEYRPRTFVCGLGFHQLLFTESARLWNARVADSLPAQINSGWMFVAEKNPKSDAAPLPYRRGLYERVRKYLNAKRWGIL